MPSALVLPLTVLFLPEVRLPEPNGSVDRLDFLTETRYIRIMKETTSNPYVQTLLEKGYSVAETRMPAPKKQFPCTIGARYFATEAEYKKALAEFLNGY